MVSLFISLLNDHICKEHWFVGGAAELNVYLSAEKYFPSLCCRRWLRYKLFLCTFCSCTSPLPGSQMHTPKITPWLGAASTETTARIWEWREWNGPPAVQTHGGHVGSAGLTVRAWVTNTTMLTDLGQLPVQCLALAKSAFGKPKKKWKHIRLKANRLRSSKETI